jgi:alanyl-tRNA synthetase
VRYGRTLGFKEPFFYKLVDVLADTMGDVFPEIRVRKKQVQETIRIEEEAFNKTLDNGIEIFNARVEFAKELYKQAQEIANLHCDLNKSYPKGLPEKPDEVFFAVVKGHRVNWRHIAEGWDKLVATIEEAQFVLARENVRKLSDNLRESSELEFGALTNLFDLRSKLIWQNVIPGEVAFRLYDTYGFPLDLTELMARERGLTVDTEGFERLMEEQRARARAAQKKEVISLSQIETTAPTKFVGYEDLTVQAKVLEVVSLKDKTAVVLDASACYAEMGGQVGDTGELTGNGQLWRINNTQKSGNTWLHFIEGGETPVVGSGVTLSVEKSRRLAIERHHTVTHLLHWALHEVASKEASQKGSFVGPDKLTFDFNSAPLTPQQIVDIEKLVNERILDNAPVSWTEVAHAQVKNRKDVMQFFGDKYGDTVRVVQIGGKPAALDGYSMELCGGTHTRATGEIGLFRIVGENAIAAGVRRIEAVAGLEAYGLAHAQLQLIRSLAGKINSPVHELEKKVDLLLAQQKDLEKSLKSAIQRNAAQTASWLVTRAHEVNAIPLITQIFPDSNADYLQAVTDALKGRFKGVVVVGGSEAGSVALVASVSPEFTTKVQAGKLIQQIAPIVGGKGGGKPDNARGGGKDPARLDEALAQVKSLLA